MNKSSSIGNNWEGHLYFGKMSKTPAMNMSCFIIGTYCIHFYID